MARKNSYSEKLKDPRWQKKRLEILQRDQWRCYYCHDANSTLHVHHLMYLGENPWDTPDECLMTLCEDCHSCEHLEFTELERLLFDTVRTRDIGNYEMIQMINRCVKRAKGVPID